MNNQELAVRLNAIRAATGATPAATLQATRVLLDALIAEVAPPPLTNAEKLAKIRELVTSEEVQKSWLATQVKRVLGE